MLPSKANIEIDRQIQGSASTLERCKRFKASLATASKNLDSAIASARRRVLGHITSRQQESQGKRVQALYEDLGALRYKVAVLEENMKRLMKQGYFLAAISGQRLEEVCLYGLGGNDGKGAIRGVMSECEEKWESISKRCRENEVLLEDISV